MMGFFTVFDIPPTISGGPDRIQQKNKKNDFFY